MNSKPRYRFFLGGQLLNVEPVGWNTVLLVLERDTQFWSLVESIEQPFEFIADGYDYIKDARRNGINAQITFESDISFDAGVTWEEFFNGLLDLTTLIEIENKRRYQCTLLRTGAWSKVINKRSTQVNIWGKAAEQTTDLPSQRIRKIFRSETYPASDSNAALITFNTTTTDKYGIIDLNKVVTDELEVRFGLSNSVQSSPLIPPFFKVKEEAPFTDIDVEIWLVATSTILTEYPQVDMYIQLGDAAPIQLTQTNFGIDGISGAGRYTYSATVALTVGETIKLWIQDDSGLSNTTFLSPLYPEISFIEIIAETETEDTEAEGFFIHDATRAIVNEISEDAQYFYSEYFGGDLTEEVDYDETGCGMLFKLFKGINVRGESLDDHPFTFSLDDMWQGIDNIFCLGLGYEVVSFSVFDGAAAFNKEVIRIEPREYFFDDTSNSVELDGFNWDNNLEISFDPQFLMTAIKTGFEKWEAETLVGTDDPQTVHDYSTILETAGAKDSKDKKILSSFYAASSGIEGTRRKIFEPKKDWRLDEETFIIQTNILGNVTTYGGVFVTNLLNDGTRYNVRLTPANNFIKWGPWLSIGFQDYPEQLFYFVGGEGNINMVFDNPFAEDCELEWGTYVNERGDREIVESPFLPFVYKFSCPFNWEQWTAIRDNRRKSIQLNYRNNEGEETSVILFIRSLKYDPSRSGAEFECWLKRVLPTGTTVEGSLEGFGTWAFEDAGSTFTPVELTGPSDSRSVEVEGLIGTVEILVGKDTNGGLAEGDGEVRFYKNGVLEPGTDVVGAGNDGTQTFVDTGNVGNVSYQYTGIVITDVLRIEIQEG